MVNNKSGYMILVVLTVLIILVIALWRQNSSLKFSLGNDIGVKSGEEGVITGNISKEEELKLLQSQLKQLLDLKKQLE